jgi:glucose/arabinose dehydrogenase
MVLHPGFAKNQKFYFAKHTVTDGKFSTVISEGIASNDLKTNSDAPPREVYKWNEVADVHYGGGLAFGPDGFLYIGTGDSGPQEDPHGNAQNMMLPLGKMLRIDVDHSSSGQSYSIPRDNPFRKNPKVLPEIWASGLREPWRFSFDSKTGNLWLGDVGQDRYEEVDIVRPGENYGWNVYEGFERFSNQYRREGSVYVAPVFAYPRKFGVSVTGGFVYRGDRKSAFYGSYIFGDYQSRRLWSLTAKNRSLTSIQQIGVSPEPIVSFGCDRRGEIYVVGYDGMIYHLELPQ